MSDRELRALQRLYAADPTNGNAANYIAALERCTGSVSDENQPVFDHPITRHLTLALADNGLISSLDELKNITEISQLEQLVHYLFPYGSLGDFESFNFDWATGDIVVDETQDDWFRVHTGIHGFPDNIPPLVTFFEGHGRLIHRKFEQWEQQDLPDSVNPSEILWMLPYRRRISGWWDEVAPIDRLQAWREQGLVYWSPNE